MFTTSSSAASAERLAVQRRAAVCGRPSVCNGLLGGRFEGKTKLPGLALQLPDLRYDFLLQSEALPFPKSSGSWVLLLDDESSGHGAINLHPFPQVFPDSCSNTGTSGIRPKEEQTCVPLIGQWKSSQQFHNTDQLFASLQTEDALCPRRDVRGKRSENLGCRLTSTRLALDELKKNRCIRGTGPRDDLGRRLSTACLQLLSS